MPVSSRPASCAVTSAAASSTVSTRWMCSAPSAGRGPATGAAARRGGLGPVRAADEHHRRDRVRGGVVVLAGVLEDLLHRPGRAGQEHDAGVADLQQDRFPGGVAEVLRDRGGEHVGRLVAVEPRRHRPGCRDRSTPWTTAERLARPLRRRTAGTTGTPASEPTAVARSSRDEPARRPPRLAASIAPGPPPVATTCVLPEHPAQPRGVGVRRRGAVGRRAHPSRRPGGAREARRSGPRRWRGRAAPGRASPSGSAAPWRPGVGARVQRVGVGPRVVQLGRRVERRPVAVDGGVTAVDGRRRPLDGRTSIDRPRSLRTCRL